MQEMIERVISEAASLDDLARLLTILLNGNFSIWTDGTLIQTRARVEAVEDIVITINPREHAPPHFHIKGGGTNAALRISDGSLLDGCILPKHSKLIGWWFPRSKPKLVTLWNMTRPSDCPVGKIMDEDSQQGVPSLRRTKCAEGER